MSNPSFADLGLPDRFVDVLADDGITEPFPVQAATIPDSMAGRDVAGRAPTGSGKTLAFGLPILARVKKAAPNKPEALILAPTRELAAQIRLDLAPFGKATGRQVFAVFGGVRYNTQRDWLGRGVDVLVATPGRLEDLIEQRIVDLSHVKIVAIDEADRMADMGFLPPVKRILDQTAKKRQTLLFSATLDGDVATLIKRYQDNPARHEVGGAEPQATEATHHFWMVEKNEKVDHAAAAIGMSSSTIVFARTRHGADRLAKQLSREGVRAVSMHGGRSQNQRNRALKDFADGKVEALVATDVAARGIHVDDVATVVHFDPPQGHKDYLHRSGRTARAGASGTVVSLVTPKEKRAVIRMQRNLNMDEPIRPARPEKILGDTRSQIADPSRNAKAKTGSPRSEARTRKSDRSAPNSGRDHRPRAQKPTKQTSHGQSNGAKQDVYIGNLPWKVRDEELAKLLGKHGKVYDAKVKMDRRGRSKGVGFVTMPKSDASRAVHELNGKNYSGRPLKVRFAT